MEWWQTTLTIFAGIITCLTLWDKIESRVKSEKQPTNELEARVENRPLYESVMRKIEYGN